MSKYDGLRKKVRESFTKEDDMKCFDGGKKWLEEAWFNLVDKLDYMPEATYEATLIFAGVLDHVMDLPGRAKIGVTSALTMRDIVNGKLTELCYGSDFKTNVSIEEINDTSINKALIQLSVAVLSLSNRFSELFEGSILDRGPVGEAYDYKPHEIEILADLNAGKLNSFLSTGKVDKSGREVSYDFSIRGGEIEIRYSIAVPNEDKTIDANKRVTEFTERFSSDLAKLNFLLKYGHIFENEIINKFIERHNMYSQTAKKELAHSCSSDLEGVNPLAVGDGEVGDIYSGKTLDEVLGIVSSLFGNLRINYRKHSVLFPLVKDMLQGVRLLVEKGYDYGADRIKVIYMYQWISDRKIEIYSRLVDENKSSDKKNVMEKLLAELEYLCQ